DQGERSVELHLDLERPGDPVDRVAGVVDDAMQIKQASGKVREEWLEVSAVVQPAQHKKEYQANNVRRLQARDPTPVVGAQRDGRPVLERVRGKGNGENESA